MNRFAMEQTLSIIKPDAVQRNLENNIIPFFTKQGLKIIDKKKIRKVKGFIRKKKKDL